MATKQTVERDGVTYNLGKVCHESKCVGFAPTLPFGTLEEMADVMDEKTVLELAVRQYEQDAKNKVRAKFLGGKVGATRIVAAINKKTITVEQVQERMALDETSFEAAAVALLGLNVDVKKANPEMIHWDIL